MKISVFITSYNQKDYLIEAIESVLSQTLKPHQIIVVDDFSWDGSRELIAEYVSRYPGLVEAIYHSKNMGVTRSRIDALNAVTGDYVTYVDGDDRYLPTKLEKEAKVLRDNPQAQIAFSNNYYMSEDGGEYLWVWCDNVFPPEGYVFKETFTRSYPRMSLFRMELVHYESWKKIGFHDPRLGLYEDFEMRIRLTKELKTAYYNEPLTEIRSHNKGLSSSQGMKHFAALDYVYSKSKRLLSDLNPSERRECQKKLLGLVAKTGFRAFKQLKRDFKSSRGIRVMACGLSFKYVKYKLLSRYYRVNKKLSGS